MRRWRVFAALLLGLLLTIAPANAAAVAQPKPHLWLTVLHNNDGESKLLEGQFAVPGTSPVITETHAGVARSRRSSTV